MKRRRIPLMRVVLGLGLVALGVLLLLQYQGMIELGNVWQYWPALLILMGAAKFVQADTREDQGSGIGLILIGAWLLVSFLHWWELTFRETWPAVFIAIGIPLLWKSLPPMSNRVSTQESGHE
jgi:hypothetical protein